LESKSRTFEEKKRKNDARYSSKAFILDGFIIATIEVQKDKVNTAQIEKGAVAARKRASGEASEQRASSENGEGRIVVGYR